MNIRVLIADDHEVVRMGLRAALDLEDGIEVVGDVADGAEAVRAVGPLRPDVVLMDVRMPGMDGIAACRAIREFDTDVKVLMLTSYSDEQDVMSAVMAGATGYLIKNTPRAQLIAAVRAAAKGESTLDPSVATQVLAKLQDLAHKDEDHQVAVLSAREREVVALVAKGYTNKEIGSALVISDNTARNHVVRILDKLGLTRRSEAASFATRHGLTDPPE
jgi:DNA-binding NarL/FixJ family response regulator